MAGKVSTVYELPRHIEKNFERGSFGMCTLRFRATVELSKPIFSGFFLRRTGIKDLWLQYQYEKLPRICYKCGLMTHEHKFCFKTPAMIKDTNGEFFPMYGNWMAEDTIEWSPFNLPLSKWFSEGIIEGADSRELRTQYPGKRRQVETVVETRVSSGELVINRYPAVTLSGIGEVTPFENTTNLIVEKILPELPPLEVIRTMQKKKDVPSCSGTKLMPAKDGIGHTVPNSPSDHQIVGLLGDVLGIEPNIEPSNFLAVGVQVANEDNDKLKGILDDTAQVDQNFIWKSPWKVGPEPQSPFGTQAHIMEYPSKECWDLAFNQLLGAQTIDKFHREPTLFNPILDIEEIRCYEVDQGPRKRKVTNGFYMLPKKEDDRQFHQNYDQRDTPRYEGRMDSPIPNSGGGFSPGSIEKGDSQRRRGRPRKNIVSGPKPSEPTRKRGRPTKDAKLAMKPKSFKKESDNKRKNKVRKHYCNSWDNASVELAIDMNNHFVVIEKNMNMPSQCVIEEIAEAAEMQRITSPNTTNDQLDATKHSNPDVVVLTETRIGKEKCHRLCLKLHFIDGSYVPPDGSAGGFGVFWSSGLKGTVMSEEKNLINVVIESEPPGSPWNLLGVYCPPTIMGREAFWNNIGDLILKNMNPSMIIGALNGMIDLGSQRGKFTWFQKTKATNGGCELKRARLDRVLPSIKWKMLYPNAITHVLSAATSDHRPILLDTNGGINCNKSNFKYELMWGRDPKCYWVVKNAWKDKLHQQPMINFYRKLKNTKEHLARWNKVWLEDGGWEKNLSNIANLFIARFNNTYIDRKIVALPSLNCLEECIISSQDNEQLKAFPTEREIERCIRSMGQERALGPDGMSPLVLFAKIGRTPKMMLQIWSTTSLATLSFPRV
uniref:Zinc knuckle CX2CX4HX4C domain-containing protein n=1 Tax=Cannabis sativa TaxID=3483 RepID=A0A803Q7L3_CANSA